LVDENNDSTIQVAGGANLIVAAGHQIHQWWWRDSRTDRLKAIQ
jgi:hypothetical protein